jgi:hypothetical protein
VRRVSTGGWHDFGGDPLAKLGFRERELVGGLQVEPETRAVAEIAGEPKRRLGRNTALAVQNVGDAARRGAQRKRKRVGRQATRFDLIFQDSAGMDGSHRAAPLVIVDDFNIPGVAVLETQTKTPAAMHTHRQPTGSPPRLVELSPWAPQYGGPERAIVVYDLAAIRS